MAYEQSPMSVLKAQMTNKAVGLAHSDSMAYQTDGPGDEKKNDSIPADSTKKDKDLKLMKSLQGINLNFDSGSATAKQTIQQALDNKENKAKKEDKK